jgi:hypothetical protein
MVLVERRAPKPHLDGRWEDSRQRPFIEHGDIVTFPVRDRALHEPCKTRGVPGAHVTQHGFSAYNGYGGTPKLPRDARLCINLEIAPLLSPSHHKRSHRLWWKRQPVARDKHCNHRLQIGGLISRHICV